MKKNREIAQLFNEIADALEFKNENTFKVVAFRKAARIMEELTEDVVKLVREDKLRAIPGIGTSMAEAIEEYVDSGRMQRHRDATAGIPPALLDLLNVQGLGPRTVALAHHELGVRTLADLKKVIANGTLAALPRMGEKKVDNIRKGIELFERSHERLSIAIAEQLASAVIIHLREHAGVTQVSPAGSLRRWKETIGDIDILATGPDPARIVKTFTGYPGVEQVLAAGATKASILVEDVQIDLRVVAEQEYGAALMYFTGSKEHNVKMRGLALARGLKLNEYGLFRGDRYTAGRTEEEVFRALGMEWIPPELREDRGEVERAQEHALPQLVELEQIRGDLQMHSTYSDSSAELRELAATCRGMGYEYLLITDHSKSAHYAHGMDVRRLRKQWDEIDALNRRFRDFKILKGVEVDIVADGTLDYADDILSQLDLVVASIHQGFTKRVTERMCAAMENPYVDIIGHPTGRLISKREGYTMDLDRVMEQARRTGTWLECNAYPDRLDLNDLNLKQAGELGIRVSLGTDSHSVEDLTAMKYGVATCRRGWLKPEEVVNTYSLTRLLKSRKRNARKR